MTLNYIVFGIYIGLAIYFTLKYEKIRATNYVYVKTAASLCFVAIGLISFANNQSSFDYAILIMLGLIFGLIGDVALALKDKKNTFHLGVVAFGIGHIFYIIAFSNEIGFSIYEPILIVIILMCAFILKKIIKLDMGKSNNILTVYAAVISTMLIKVCSLAYQVDLLYTRYLLVGAILFVVSDLILASQLFIKPSKGTDLANKATYFTGQILIALSILYYIG